MKRRKTILLCLAVLLVSSCQKVPSHDLMYDDACGYNFKDFLGQDQQTLLEELERNNISVEEERIGDEVSVLQMEGRFFGDATKVSILMFAAQEEADKADLYRRALLLPVKRNLSGSKLYRYYEIAEIAWWPSDTDELGEKVIRLFEKLQKTYGEPDFCSPQIGGSGIIGKPVNRQIEWNLPEDDLNISIQISGDKDSFHFMITYSSIEGEKAQREKAF